MRSRKLYNVLEGFDFQLLDHPEFREDSVREEIITPIIKGLGYSASKPNQIIRSRRLLHPFVSIGSQRKEIYIIPDYLFEVQGTPAWILDAKAPCENITKSVHVEQAYSYAIHSEVRVWYFALCNGREFVLYRVDKNEPIFHFPIRALPMYWDSLKQYLAPAGIFQNNPYNFKKDFGLHLKRLGFGVFESLIFHDVPIIYVAQLDPDMFTFSSGINHDGVSYVVTFDFGEKVFEELQDRLPTEAIEKLAKRTASARQVVKFGENVYYVDIDCRVGTKLEENKDEIWQPLVINSIFD